jgi:hypothetical protein
MKISVFEDEPFPTMETFEKSVGLKVYLEQQRYSIADFFDHIINKIKGFVTKTENEAMYAIKTRIDCLALQQEHYPVFLHSVLDDVLGRSLLPVWQLRILIASCCSRVGC